VHNRPSLATSESLYRLLYDSVDDVSMSSTVQRCDGRNEFYHFKYSTKNQPHYLLHQCQTRQDCKLEGRLTQAKELEKDCRQLLRITLLAKTGAPRKIIRGGRTFFAAVYKYI
jgi:hypothetical protein